MMSENIPYMQVVNQERLGKTENLLNSNNPERIVKTGCFSIRGMSGLVAELRTCTEIPKAREGYRREKVNIHIDANENVNWQTVDVLKET